MAPTDRIRTVFRPLDGILLLDKPAGMSSNQALQRVRHLFRAEKAGHTGSLDPLATGLLPVCFGEATKIAGLLLGADMGRLMTCVLLGIPVILSVFMLLRVPLTPLKDEI